MSFQQCDVFVVTAVEVSMIFVKVSVKYSTDSALRNLPEIQ